MSLIQRYRRLTLWHKIGLWGAVASIVGLAITWLGSPAISQQTQGHLSPAIASNSGTLIVSTTPEALKQVPPPPDPPAPVPVGMRLAFLMALLGRLMVIMGCTVPLLMAALQLEAAKPPKEEGTP